MYSPHAFHMYPLISSNGEIITSFHSRNQVPALSKNK